MVIMVVPAQVSGCLCLENLETGEEERGRERKRGREEERRREVRDVPDAAFVEVLRGSQLAFDDVQVFI